MFLLINMENNKYFNEKHWLDLWHRLGIVSDDSVVNAYHDILNRYSEPHRKYHNVEHIKHCLSEFETVKHLASDANVLELAIWYHDAVYDINADNNEELSAALAKDVMNGFSLPTNVVEKVGEIIIATKHDETPTDYDTKLMLDIDISNIGQADEFEKDNKLIREEYSSVSDNLFANGRSNILKSFLNRPNIYLTDFFQKKYEDSARKNIASSIKKLGF